MKGAGYVLRKIIRRAITHGRLLGQNKPFLHQMVFAVRDLMQDAYPELKETAERVSKAVLAEETQVRAHDGDWSPASLSKTRLREAYEDLKTLLADPAKVVPASALEMVKADLKRDRNQLEQELSRGPSTTGKRHSNSTTPSVCR
mgnify:CR=1 FL=1